MRFLIRLLGLLAFAGAFTAAVLDGARWVAVGAFEPTSTGAALYRVAPGLFQRLQSTVEGRIGVWAWDDVLVKALLTPAFVALALLAGVLFLLSRPPPATVGRSSREP